MKKNKIIQLKQSNLQNINSVKPHKNFINSVHTFSSGNIISISTDSSIKIYDIQKKYLPEVLNIEILKPFKHIYYEKIFNSHKKIEKRHL